MKVVRSCDWEPVSWIEYLPSIGSAVYVFKHKRYQDVTACKMAKYIDVSADKVYLYDGPNHRISALYDNPEPKIPSLPEYKICNLG